jgi:PTS system nitrogen regulatory IIA component
MRFLDLLPAERVRSGLAASDKPALIVQLAGLLAGDGGDLNLVRNALAARERLGSTGLGHGVAMPHGRCAEIDSARAAFVRLAVPIEFGADDGQPVDLVAALIVPAHFTDQHLKLLAELAELFSNAEITGALREAKDSAALYQVLEKGLGAAAA